MSMKQESHVNPVSCDRWFNIHGDGNLERKTAAVVCDVMKTKSCGVDLDTDIF